MTIHHPGLLPSSVKARLLFSSSLGVTSLGIRAFSASSVSHVALYVGEGQVAEATGAGVQVITLQQALAHSDKLFALRVPDLTPDQAKFCLAGQRQRV